MDEAVECPTCGTEYSSDKGMKIHHAKAHGESLVPDQDNVQCPTCDAYFKSEHGVKLHHSRTHGESLTDSGGDIQCPSCDDWFETERGMKCHHATVHDESIAGVATECDYCGSEFRTSNTNLQQQERQFCSQECYSDWQSENRCGEDHPNWTRVGIDCEWCGDSFFKAQSIAKNRRFCSQDCRAEWFSNSGVLSGENHPHWKGGDVEVECVVCGNSYEVRPGATGRNHLCSDECKGKWISENWCGEDHPNWKGGLAEKECAQCGSSIALRQARVEKYEVNFCSTECHGKWRSENAIGENNPRYCSITVECDWCGEGLTRQPHKVDRYDHYFCDRVCFGRWESEEYSGEGNPSWAGGYDSYYGPNWEEQRRRARERDNYTCQDCGEPQSEEGPALSVHHIIPRREFVDQNGVYDHERGNRLDNLVTLCRSCHPKWEQMPGLRPDTGHAAGD